MLKSNEFKTTVILQSVTVRIVRILTSPDMLIPESMALMSGTAPSSKDASLLSSSSKNSSPVTGWNQMREEEEVGLVYVCMYVPMYV